jgi:hypothetical protein
VLQGIADGLAEQAAAHPDFAGTTFAGVWDGDGFVYVYTAADSRIEVLTELGLEVAPSVSELDTSDGGFFYELSYEQLDQLDADVIVSYHSSKDEADAFLARRSPASSSSDDSLTRVRRQADAVSPPGRRARPGRRRRYPPASSPASISNRFVSGFRPDIQYRSGKSMPYVRHWALWTTSCPSTASESFRSVR